jgi:hypothetical protein
MSRLNGYARRADSGAGSKVAAALKGEVSRWRAMAKPKAPHPACAFEDDPAAIADTHGRAVRGLLLRPRAFLERSSSLALCLEV